MIYSKWVGQLSVGMLLGVLSYHGNPVQIAVHNYSSTSGMSAAVGIIVATIGKRRYAV